LVDAAELNVPQPKAAARGRELEMAKALVEQMTEKWDPTRYNDDYTSALMVMIKEKIASGGETPKTSAKAPRSTKVIDLAAVLQESLNQATATPRKKTTKPTRRAKSRKAA
jgi:DNA end-binding protein Ku